MANYGMLNLGQEARQRHGADDVVLIGFGGHHGSVVAGAHWGAPMQRMVIPPRFVDRYGEDASDEPDRLHTQLFEQTRGGPMACCAISTTSTHGYRVRHLLD